MTSLRNSSDTETKHLAIIPARGGSKRLPGKNIALLGGKPLLHWTIEAALEAQIYDAVVVSTDSDAIAQTAIAAGAQVPSLRSASLSGDTITASEVCSDVIAHFGATQFQQVSWLQPTSPLRGANHIKGAWQRFNDTGADSVVSVCPCEHSPLWCEQLPKDGNMADFIANKNLKIRSQDLPNFYRLNGAIYMVNVSRFLEQQTFYLPGEKTYAYVMPPSDSIDIDEQWDLELAEFLMAKRQNSNQI